MTQRPHVVVNMAVTADGKIDTAARTGARISGRADTERVDRLRAESDAVLVGGHTLLKEDPRLTVRDPALVEERRSAGLNAQPMKVGVVTRIGAPGESLALPVASRFLCDGRGRVMICTTTRTTHDAVAWLRSQGAEVMVHGTYRVELGEVLAALPSLGVRRLLVEGGSTIVAALLAGGLVDEIRLAIAPIIVGGETAPTPVGGAGLHIDDAVRLTLSESTTSEDGDVVVRYRVGAVPAA